ncbi:MAG: copper resistance system multicopper oxidase [Arenicella sp.]|nr:copper resistance system multicopper oxidase [Arenicella sp.]
MTTPVLTSRRRFVTGLASTTALGLLNSAGFVNAAERLAHSFRRQPTLNGTDFTLDIAYAPVNFTGNTIQATAINGSVPAPVLRWKEGDRVKLNVRNNLAVDSSIHWHGIILPTDMDGVPGLSFAGIKPGESYQYEFDVNQSGTYWYHSHSGFQEQTGLYGAIVVEPKEAAPYHYDRDYVVMLSDWSDRVPEKVYADLKKMPAIYSVNERTLQDLAEDVNQKGLGKTFKGRSMWNNMRMSDTDISDVTGKIYTFLMNGRTPADGWTGEFKKGEKILLRVINGSAMTFFDVRIPGLKMTVVASDGNYIQPITVDEFRIGVAETYDVIVEPSSEQAYTVFCQAIDRSGYARGTLTPDASLVAQIPEMDEDPILTHADMGMSMGGMSMDGMSDDGCLPEHAAMGHCEMPIEESMAMPTSEPICTEEHAKMGHCQISKQIQEFGTGKAGFGSSMPVTSSGITMGPQIDSIAAGAQYRLDDPGVGLRNNGRRVLSYADVFNLNRTPDPREPSREIQLHLTGNMGRYMWSMDGVKYKDATPLLMTYGERLRITLVNDTMMNHPMHLHGVWSDLETGDADYIPRKHTVIVQPGSKISYLVTADAIGKWAYHCHLMYHMPGMFREVHIS